MFHNLIFLKAQMTPFPHQNKDAAVLYEKLKQYGLVYYSAEERTGKTLTSILVAERSTASRILIITKKKALSGWEETLEAYKPVKNYTLINYHKADKVEGEFDLIILDEAHAYLSGYPKTGTIWKMVAKHTKEKPLIYLSATPYAQGYHLLFNQFKLSSWSPWRQYKNFYAWYKQYGLGKKIRTPYGLVPDYSAIRANVFGTCSHLFLTRTRQELGFEHEPIDILRYVELSDSTKQLYNQLLKDEIIQLEGRELVCDTPMKLRVSLHMLEGGVAKIEDEYIVLPNTEKIEAIKQHFGDTEHLAIMYNYIAEGQKLAEHFKHAKLLQATQYAEGVDLSHIDNLVIYSMDFSTARFSQRRARQANKFRDKPINVYFYIVKDAISEQVYNVVAKNKKNFIDKLFNRRELK